MLKIADFDFEPLYYEYEAFYRHKRDIMDRIGNTLESISEELVFNAKGLSDNDAEQLRKLSDKLEAIYEGLEGVVTW